MTKFTNVEKKLCPCCNSDSTKYLGLRGGKYQREGLGIESKIVQCVNCSVIYPNPFPIPESLESIYGDPNEYFSNKEEWYARSKSFEKIVDKFIKRINKKEKIELLDIGSGRGEFIKAALSFPQVNCTGLEVSEGCIQFAKEHGIELHNKLLIELINEGRTFDGICLNAVLEHVHEPSKFMSEVSMLLKQGGMIYIDCPNEPNLVTITGNFFNRLFGKKDVYNLQPTWEPYHVFGFNPKALRILLDENNIEINEILIHGAPGMPFAGGIKDMIKVLVAIQIQRLANVMSLGTNMYIWGKKL
jgi:2-polyprenyl-3-methyl-5-hydroxy-6-metoxy-1,4-benzoquinol methylase